MGTQFLLSSAILGLIVVTPVKYHYTGDWSGNVSMTIVNFSGVQIGDLDLDHGKRMHEKGYLWAYLAFVYIFTGLLTFLLIRTSKKITLVRQAYLAMQSSITDRSVLISGIPEPIRSEEALTTYVNELGLGEVQSVTICRNWGEIDHLMSLRLRILFRLEEAWVAYGQSPLLSRNNAERLPLRNHRDGPSTFEERETLTSTEDQALAHRRPVHRLGCFGLFGKKVDTINYLTAKLQSLDNRILITRDMDFEPTASAFVTFSNVATAQLTAQALLDPVPRQLLAGLAPAPNDVVWPNTYKCDENRFVRMWAMTILTGAIAILWAVPLGVISQFLEITTIRKFLPKFADAIESTRLGQALAQGFLPTLAYTAFNACVPFIFDWISVSQGFISNSQNELSLLSKYFFYLFWNFLFFVAVGTIGNIYAIAKDTTKLAYLLAELLPKFAQFFVDLILLQGIGMFPFRLIQIGSLLYYQFSKTSCKTPRDFEELKRPPVFNFGFFLPQPILILIICLCYSVLSPWILLAGLIYFFIGWMVFKYQLLYSMEHPTHSTGIVWRMIFHRIIVGMIFYQLAMAGFFSLQKAFKLSALLTPLPFATTFILGYYVEKSYSPALQYIALRSLRKPPSRRRSNSRTVDEQREQGQKYINPNLTSPLESVWVYGGRGTVVE